MQNRSSVATVSSMHAGTSSNLWCHRHLWTLQSGPTKPTAFLGHWSPGHERANMELGRMSPMLFTT